MNHLKKWLRRISGAEKEIGELKKDKEMVEMSLHRARAELDAEKSKHGSHCEKCKNGYKKDNVYHMGFVVGGGYGCLLEIPCDKFEEKEKEK